MLTRQEYKKIFEKTTGHTVYMGVFWKEYRDHIREHTCERAIVKLIIDRYPAFYEKKIAMNTTGIIGRQAQLMVLDDIISAPTISFGDCKSATTGPDPKTHDVVNFDWEQCWYGWKCISKQKQGNNPMLRPSTNSYNAPAAVAGATIINAKSDESGQRDFLMDEFESATNWNDPMNSKLRKMFNIGAPTRPQTSAELIAAFKDGKYKVDQKKVDLNTAYFTEGEDYEGRYDDDDTFVGEQYYGITFTGLPVADIKGWEAAQAEYEAFKKNVRRRIIVGTPAEGLEALISLETWVPTQGETTTVH